VPGHQGGFHGGHPKGTLAEVLRTNEPVLLSFARTVLADGNIDVLVADQHMSTIEGSIGIFPRRLLVEGDRWRQARRLLIEAGVDASLLAPDETASP
jgi:Putative prokaryotic signal transducing protein